MNERSPVVVSLVEANSIRSTVRITGLSKLTILKLMRDLGSASAVYHDKHPCGVQSERLRTDEI